MEFTNPCLGVTWRCPSLPVVWIDEIKIPALLQHPYANNISFFELEGDVRRLNQMCLLHPPALSFLKLSWRRILTSICLHAISPGSAVCDVGHSAETLCKPGELTCPPSPPACQPSSAIALLARRRHRYAPVHWQLSASLGAITPHLCPCQSSRSPASHVPASSCTI